MLPYLDIVDRILRHGTYRKDRTGIGTKAIFGETFTWDLGVGFPATTCKYLHFKSVVAELAGFLEGTRDARRLEQLGTKIWVHNTKAWNSEHKQHEYDMGRIYGVQWRDWQGPNGLIIDQLHEVVNGLTKDPASRRHIISAWNPGELDQMCLPPCHTHFQFFVRGLGDLNVQKLDCIFYMRSVDTMLGMPFDIASYALLTHIIAQQINAYPGKLIGMFGDTHIYMNHIDGAKDLLTRSIYSSPKLILHPNATIDNFLPEMVKLEEYQYNPAIKFDLNV